MGAALARKQGGFGIGRRQRPKRASQADEGDADLRIAVRPFLDGRERRRHVAIGESTANANATGGSVMVIEVA